MNLREVIGALDEDAFFGSIFEQAPHHAQACARDLRSVLDPDAVLALATRDDARFPDVAMASGDRSVPPRTYSRRRVIQPDALRREYAAGATVVLKHVGRQVPALARALRRLGRLLGARVAANAYLSPAGASGFAPHWDTHDVFAVQLTGRKHWQLYATHDPWPLTKFRDSDRDPGPVTHELTLEAGDSLYIPSGLVHSARATEEPSLHLALGVYPIRVLDAAVEAVAARSLRDATMRRALRAQRPDDELERILADALREVADDRDALRDALASARADVARRRGDRDAD